MQRLCCRIRISLAEGALLDESVKLHRRASVQRCRHTIQLSMHECFGIICSWQRRRRIFS